MMGLGFSAWNLFVSLLFLCAQVLSKNLHDSHLISSYMNHMDPSVIVFFTLKDLKNGETTPVYFFKRDPYIYPQALPREEADSIPFSLKQLPYLFQFFSFSDDSPLAKAMEGTLNHCDRRPNSKF
ncbi:hypothetical protein CUMW_241000 [Citrus unshiu]|uniref:BURP domain-containing protein n=1 Tax=Citrus unshiu TaxID=55188 RepID=A0A2H5QLE7_CITUN|nr:hypothetical protein CUMW_241000 [Citrus unshiu]